jgi:glucose-6-phosphate-specific signal transduction histidine kinase
VDVPVQFFQSTIAIELAVAGALLWEIRYFERDSAAARDSQQLPNARLQLLFALVIGATLFGSLWAIADGGKALTATLVTTGVAISLLPILIRVLPPLARDARTSARDPDYAVTVVGLFVYVFVVGGVIALINID